MLTELLSPGRLADLMGAGVFWDGEDFAKLVIRLVVDLFFAGIVIHVVYFRLYRNREYLFTYYMFNIITFTMCFLLRKVPIELGFALGLFAVFGILRYRTEAIRIRDLTYLFIVIGLGILNALANKKISVFEIIAVNSIIAGATAYIELSQGRGHTRSVPVLYDNVKLLRPGAETELIADLAERTGLDVVSVEVGRIDMLRDAAEVSVVFRVSR